MPKPKFIPLTFTPSPPPTSPPPLPPAKKTTPTACPPKIVSSTNSKKTTHGSRSTHHLKQEKSAKPKHQPHPASKKRIRHKEDLPLAKMNPRDLRRYTFLGKKVDEQKEKAGKEKIVPKKSMISRSSTPASQKEDDLWDRTRQDARAWTSVSGMGSGEVWGMRKGMGYGGVMVGEVRGKRAGLKEGGEREYVKGEIGVYRGRFNRGKIIP